MGANANGKPKYLDIEITCGNCGYEWVEHIADTTKEKLPKGAMCGMCGHSGKFNV